MSVRRLPSGKWQATISLGTCSTKEEAEALCSTTLPASCSTTPAPEISCSTTPTPETTASPSAGTTERQPGRLADYLSPASIALLDEVMAAVPTIPSMDRAADRALAIFKKYMWEQQTNPDWIAYKRSLKQP